MRGKDHVVRLFDCRHGITPAYAGKRGKGQGKNILGRDHPRLCGEKFSIHCKVICRKGSPPPMRGKAISAAPGDHIFRITPAYAGKSVRWFPARYGIRDHPRLCGEKLLMDTFVTSSCRITPAYAGKSFFGTMIGIPKQDHPRLCGEKVKSLVQQHSGTGSPPPMRGKVPAGCRSDRQSGITPAYAGKRRESTGKGHTFQDHPRLCGEKQHGFYAGTQHLGSPPPMRGKAVYAVQVLRKLWITPAYAGKRGYL